MWMNSSVGSSGVLRAVGALSLGAVWATAALSVSSSGKEAWVPSQYGGFPVCLHMHRCAVSAASTVKVRGTIPVPRCEPSQNGCVEERPQAHQ